MYDSFLNLNFLSYDSLVLLGITGLLSLFLYRLFYLIYSSQKWLKFFNIPEYQGDVQKIHTKTTARLGGFVIYLGLFLFGFLSNKSTDGIELIRAIIISSIPLVIFALFEDLFHNIKPVFRFLGILFSSFLFLNINIDPFPIIDIRWAALILNNSIIATIFYIVSIAAITNGMNIIDGSNGLASIAAFLTLLTIFFISYYVHDLVLMAALFPILCFLLLFIFVNYPSGFVFLGDLGAYFLGFIISIFCIVFYGRHPNYPSWGALILIIYPLIEVVFSFIRKPLMGRSFFKPDEYHLHLLLFAYLRLKNESESANWKVVIYLFPLIAMPLTALAYFSNKHSLLMLFGFSVLMYFSFYLIYLFKSIKSKI
jgi:UDP-N-acetylmuramyl pentapeptide phosphotransferase/UDP-N-acetylglucosamine-1-phosphate transferase